PGDWPNEQVEFLPLHRLLRLAPELRLADDQRSPDPPANPARQAAESGLEKRLAVQAHRVEELGLFGSEQRRLGQDEEHAVPDTEARPVDRTVDLPGAGEAPANEETDHLNPLDQELPFQGGPEEIVVHSIHGEQGGDAEVAKPIVKALREQQADEDAAPRSLLPGARADQRNISRSPGALVIDQ